MDQQVLLSLAAKYGSPLYVYDAEKIIFQFNRLKDAFSDARRLRINFATKALSNISILKLLKKAGANIDCVSIEEVQLGLLAGFDPKQISFTPSGVSFEEIESAVDLGVIITLDNLIVLEYFGKRHSGLPVSIRINPNVMGGGNEKISVGHHKTKFGIPVYQIGEVLEIEKKYKMQINGVHMHTGSDILKVETFMEAAEILFSVAKRFEHLDFIDFGGGFKVSYKEGDPATDIEKFGKIISKRFNEFSKEYGKDLEIVFEPGKFLVSESGYFLVKVNLIKEIKDISFVAVDSGFNHLIRPMYYGAYHHIVNISNPKGTEKQYNVVGYICETDTFAENRMISEVRKGDILCFRNAGAYAFTMASNYNSRLRPAEVMVYKGKDYLIRERENIEDLTRNQIVTEI